MQKQPTVSSRAGVRQDAIGDPRLAADADDVHVLDALEELVLAEGAGHGLEVEALGPEDLVGARVDVLQEEDLDLILRE